ncbi:MAG: TonB-dependent receptor [Rubricoccaceae bacterium]
MPPSSLRVLRALARASLLLLVAGVPALPAAAQVWGEIAGRVTSATDGQGIPGATVLVEGTNFGTAAAADGRFAFRIPEGRYPVRVSAVGYAPLRDTVTVLRGQTTRLEARLGEAGLDLGEAVVQGQAAAGVGISTITPQALRAMPTGLADALRSVQVQLGVTSNNELSNAYSVRGGSYNDNQYFVDGFEVYRPLRTKQGEQEGLGLVNGDLTERMTLYAGGFPVRYGGKLASVLDATYARPEGPVFGTAYASTLDAGATVQAGLGRAAGLAVAVRSARPRRFFAGQELTGAYDPDFRDAQGVFDARLGARHGLRAVGLYARQRYRFAPTQRTTTFGIFPNIVRTIASEYAGTETTGYDIVFGGVRLTSVLAPALRAEHAVSTFRTDEFEQLDVTARTTLFRRIQRPDTPTEFDQIAEGQSSQRDLADNTIRLTTATAEGRYLFAAGRHAAEAGWSARLLAFDDVLFETTRVAGRDLDGNPVAVTVDSLSDAARLSARQAALWLEDTFAASERLTLTAGLRADYFSFTNEWTLAPRASATLRLAPETALSAAVGVYHQAPTYRELRGDPAPGESILGALNRDLRSQRAVQLVVGGERFFPARRLALRAEGYYKHLDRLISYEVRNVRVAYSGHNDTRGFAYGADVQLRAELVPGLESTISYGYLRTRERFLEGFETPQNAGLRARPTDRPHNLTLFVQDHLPGDDTWTLHLRTLYASGLPYTPPRVSQTVGGVDLFEPGFRHVLRYPSFLRFDVGATKKLRLGRAVSGGPLFLHATAEVLNVFDMKNVIAYSFVGDDGRAFQAVPTRLTPLTINTRLRVDF